MLKLNTNNIENIILEQKLFLGSRANPPLSFFL
jgi:hypothetical protein